MAINEKQKWPTNKSKYDENYEKIFGEKKKDKLDEAINKIVDGYSDVLKKLGDNNNEKV